MAKTKKKALPKFPDVLYVCREEGTGGDPDFFIACEDPDALEDGQIVAVYEMRKVWKTRVVRELEAV